MEQVLHELHWTSLLFCIGSIIVIAPDFETHLQRLEEVFCCLQRARLKLKPAKSELLLNQVRYLCLIMSPSVVATDPGKVRTIRDWSISRGLKEL